MMLVELRASGSSACIYTGDIESLKTHDRDEAAGWLAKWLVKFILQSISVQREEIAVRLRRIGGGKRFAVLCERLVLGELASCLDVNVRQWIQVKHVQVAQPTAAAVHVILRRFAQVRYCALTWSTMSEAFSVPAVRSTHSNDAHRLPGWTTLCLVLLMIGEPVMRRSVAKRNSSNEGPDVRYSVSYQRYTQLPSGIRRL